MEDVREDSQGRLYNKTKKKSHLKGLTKKGENQDTLE